MVCYDYDYPLMGFGVKTNSFCFLHTLSN